MATGNNPKRPELTASELSQIDAVCDRFESAWESGRAPEIAPYLAGIEEPLRSRLRKELEAVSAERKGRRAQVMDLERFARLLLRSGLMTAEQLEPFLDKQPKDAQALARELFRSQKLTEYQAKTILRGKTKELVFGDYVVLDEIGAGGMGVVLKARHRRMDRIVALKVLPPKTMKLPEAVDRFYREVKAAARLSHPNIVTAHDAGESEGTHYFVMEYVEGQDLANLVKERNLLPVDEAIEYILQAARGLGYAHERGIVHRDIKPANLLLDASGTIKILDMGLARFEQGLGEEERDRLTQSGQVMGTCDYMAPEQAEDTHRADRRADIYSLGCTLHRLLTGKAMYTGSTLMEILLAHRNQPIPSLSETRPDVSSQLDTVYQRLVAKQPEDRYQSMGEVIAALESCRKAVPVGVGGVAVLPDGERSDGKLRTFLPGVSPAREETIQRQADMETGRLAPPHAAAGKSDRRTWRYGAVAGVAVLVLTLSVAFLWRGGGRETPPQVAQAPSHATGPTQGTSQPGLQKRESEQIATPTAASSTEAAAVADQEQNTKPPEEAEMPSEPPAEETSAEQPETGAKTADTVPTPPPAVQEDPAAKARRELLEAWRAAEAKYTAVMEPVEAKVGAWDFAAAWQASEGIRFDEPELKTRLEVRRDEIRRMELLKRRIIEKVGQAEPPLKKSDLKIRGLGGEIIDAGPAGITTRTMKGEVERLTWNNLGGQAIGKLLELAVNSANGEDCLAAGLLAMASGNRKAAEEYLERAKAAGANITTQLTAVVASALVEASDLLSQKEYEKAVSLLENLEIRYADRPWLAAHRETFDAALMTARAGVREGEAEALYNEAVRLHKDGALFDLQDAVERLKKEYAECRPVKEVGRTPSITEFEQAIADLGNRLTVRLDGKGQFTSIQKAIDAAEPNGLIEIWDKGPYSETLIVPAEKSGLSIRGKGGSFPQISSLGQTTDLGPHLVQIEAPGVTLERLVLLHAPASLESNARCLGVTGEKFRLISCLIYMPRSNQGCYTLAREPSFNACVVLANLEIAAWDSCFSATNCVFWNFHFLVPAAVIRSCVSHIDPAFGANSGASGFLLFGGDGTLIDSIADSVTGHDEVEVKIESSDILTVLQQIRLGPGCLSTNPKFRDPANLDFRLMPDSPCIGKASDGGDIGCRYTPEMMELCRIALELRAKGMIKF